MKHILNLVSKKLKMSIIIGNSQFFAYFYLEYSYKVYSHKKKRVESRGKLNYIRGLDRHKW